MKILLGSFIVFASLNVLYAQGSNSVQFHGGFIMPISSSKGLTASGQFNYSIHPNANLYIYTGYASWDRYNVVYHKHYFEKYKTPYFKIQVSDEHKMIPVFLGIKINFNSTPLFTTYVSMEAGYSYLEYFTYDHHKIEDRETGELMGYFATRKDKVYENIVGMGIGAGLIHPMKDNASLVFEIKLHSSLYASQSVILDSRTTYTTFLIGFNFLI
jgi:hypothetical protein